MAETPKTAMSMKEIMEYKAPSAMRNIGELVEKDDSITDPLQRAEVERRIAENYFALHSFLGKLGTAFLTRVGRKLSDNEIRTLFLAYPKNPLGALKSYREKRKKTLDKFRDESGDVMHTFYGLRRLSVQTKKVVISDVGARLAWIQKRVQQISSKTMETTKRLAKQTKQSGKNLQEKGKGIWSKLFPKKPSLQPVRI